MKKILLIIMFLIVVACDNKSMNYIIENKPSIIGIVVEVHDQYILIEENNHQYVVSLNVENKDSMTHFLVNDEVVVYYDGNIAESDPMQINKVYAITLKQR